MSLSEEVKAEARFKAHFRCVICRTEPAVEVHNIVPISEGGSDNIDNAAPVCAACHARFGNDPAKRNQIREMRNQWYEVCSERYQDREIRTFVANTARIYDRSVKAHKGEGVDITLMCKEIQDSLVEIYSIGLGRLMTPRSYEDMATTSGYIGAASTVAGTVPFSRLCASCGGSLMQGARFCPNCGAPTS